MMQETKEEPQFDTGGGTVLQVPDVELVKEIG